MWEKEKKKEKSNYEENLLPYSIIQAASAGEPEAMERVLRHYERYIVKLSRRKFWDEYGNVYCGIDEDIRNRLRSKLIRAVLSFRV